MPGWTRHEGLAVPLPLENIDTDQLIPARFMSTPRTQGYGSFLLHDLRRDGDGQPDPDFPLNRPDAGGASILLAGRNFGAGSSREAAVYALVDAGFRVVIAPSFGDIFASNAVNNGLLPAQLPAERIALLLEGGPVRLVVDLAAGTIEGDGVSERFSLDAVWTQKLINGWDDIDLTRSHMDAIEAFADTRRAGAPWVWPAAGGRRRRDAVMALEYAPNGLLAVLVPQANTTVEAEMRFLVPPDQAWIAGRLTSGKATIEDRLRDYLETYATAMAQFANAPVAAAGFACTGASYLLGRDREDQLLSELAGSRGHPVHTAATAITDGLAAFGARRIALVSPYDDKLTETCEDYWASRGFEVVRTASVWRISQDFHPIYSLESDAAGRALDTLDGTDADAVVLLGTGLPTLRPILARPFVGTAPVMSSNLCLAWRLAESAAGNPASADTLLDWIAARHHGWGDALARTSG